MTTTEQKILNGFEDIGDFYNTLELLKQEKLQRKPKKNCKHCYERGYIGLNVSNEKIMCKCLN